MFLPSDDAIRHLCTALYALRHPDKLLENYGLIQIDEYLAYDDNDAPYHRKPSWEELKIDLDHAKKEKGEQLRNMCSELLRRSDDENWFHEHPLDNYPSARFQDAMVQFQKQLVNDGYKISDDGFQILELKPTPSVADEALLKAIQSAELPQMGTTVTAPDPRRVFVIHGRDERLRKGMFDFLRALDLSPLEWTEAVRLTGKASPYILEVLDSAFSQAQAVVVLFSPDDEARLRPVLWGSSEPFHEKELTPQARPNVLFEAGMAMARNPDRTILVEIGTLRPFSDIGGRHAIRMDNTPQKRWDLALRLQKAGCPIKPSGTDWQTAGDLAPPVGAIPNGTMAQTGPHPVKRELEISLSAEGTPPSQVIKVLANLRVSVSRVEYMLSNEACIASEDVLLKGETLEVPLNHDLLTKVWNIPRTDRNLFDGSGPARLALTVSANDKTRQYVLPIHMGNIMQGSTAYRKIVGSKTFHGVP